MTSLYKLKNKVKHYDWGSPLWIPQLLGVPNHSGEPWAELWMGVHPGGPSEAETGGNSRLLSEIIEEAPPRYLGERAAAEFGGLPFLFKFLAAEKPLSIQAHPNIEQARSGWERENLRGIPPDAPRRNYRDRNHKPEILCALSPFKAMCGFRELPEIITALDCFSREAPAPVRKSLDPLRASLEAALPASAEGVSAALSGLLRGLFGLSAGERRDLARYAAREGEGLCRKHPGLAGEWRTAAYFAGLYPQDPALIAPLYLNLLNLEPGEAVYLPAGVLHAYVKGFGVELMANSDNVLRGGLSSKPVDMGELLGILHLAPFKPRILRPAAADTDFTYPSECREFSLTLLRGRGPKRDFPLAGPGIAALTEGEALFSVEGGGEAPALRLRPGESVFIPARQNPGELSLFGTFSLYFAGLGAAASAGNGEGR